MKNLITSIIGILLVTNLFSQKVVSGKYFNYWNQKIELKPDSTFRYEYRFDLFYDKVIGKWRLNSDTLYLNEIIICDTVYYKDTIELSSGTTVYMTKKELIRSEDDNADVFHDRPELLYIPYIPRNASFDIKKLYIKRNKLFKIDNSGEIIKTKRRCPIRKKRYSDYFIKQK